MVVELPTGTVTLVLLGAWDERTELADTLEVLATMTAQEGETERVVRLLAGAAAIRSAALGRDVLAAAAADDVAAGRAMTFDQVRDHAAAWADQRSRATT
jgi:hypothetical protein